MPLTEHMAESIDVIIDIAETFERDVIFLGDGVPVHKEKLAKIPTFILHLLTALCSVRQQWHLTAKSWQRKAKPFPATNWN